jgi:phenylalanine-4-hydroxylase
MNITGRFLLERKSMQCSHSHSHQTPTAAPAHKADQKIEMGLEAFNIRQDWHAYSAVDHRVWQTLYDRRIEHLHKHASRAFLHGIEVIGLTRDEIPNLEKLNARLERKTGWRAVPVSGFLEPKLFFQSLAKRRFPTTVTIRSADSLDYIPEPDIFHDVFGHVPLHAHPVFADFLQRFGMVAANAGEEHTEAFTRLFWFTVEFGLSNENGETKVYGSGLISSHGDCVNALSDNCVRHRFALRDVIAQPFEIDDLQPVLFEVRSFTELFAAVEELARLTRAPEPIEIRRSAQVAIPEWSTVRCKCGCSQTGGCASLV